MLGSLEKWCTCACALAVMWAIAANWVMTTAFEDSTQHVREHAAECERENQRLFRELVTSGVISERGEPGDQS